MRKSENPLKGFWGNNQDFKHPFNHKYNEPDSDRGASDEGWGTPKPRDDSRFRRRGIKLW
jgi:hypothetical protein